ncbi:MAG: Lrp/AsnC family transcriptional regulator [Rhodocyclaceae bacterium]|jgi:DNA-binding Lrp family transcriptional regulator|nr:Lrp/AsnC family transcriptional regulator [Rhodocyclaceae bacterium]
MAHETGAGDVTLDEADRALVNALQGGFPLCDEPYRAIAETVGLGLTEVDVLNRLQSLLERKVLTRFGPMYQVERMGGAFVLAALKVPEPEYERIAGIVNALPEVAHNYRREHALNMWFVLATEQPEGIAAAIAKIEAATGLPVFAFPKEREYFVEMKLHA